MGSVPRVNDCDPTDPSLPAHHTDKMPAHEPIERAQIFWVLDGIMCTLLPVAVPADNYPLEV